jgi:hypothetical protein
MTLNATVGIVLLLGGSLAMRSLTRQPLASPEPVQAVSTRP